MLNYVQLLAAILDKAIRNKMGEMRLSFCTVAPWASLTVHFTCLYVVS